MRRLRTLGAWRVIAILSIAQFVLIVDTTAINVSISEIVTDLDSSVEWVQFSITAYILVMASAMLLGGRLGDRWGRRRTFRIGLVIFATGSALTSVSGGPGTLFLGWSVIDGIGAALIIPAMVALVADNYLGGRRVVAYGLLGAVAAAASAAGPVIGGLIVEVASWRLLFAVEVVIALSAVFVSGLIPRTPHELRTSSVDWVGGALSILGLLLVVLSIQRSSTWGWLTPDQPPRLGGTSIEPFGLSPVPFMLATGIAILLGLFAWIRRREASGAEPLVRLELLGRPPLRAAVGMAFTQQVVVIGTYLAIPLYLQIVLGEDGLETGVRLLPISLAMLVTALGAPLVIGDRRPRLAIGVGLAALLLGTLILVLSLERRLESTELAVGLALMGFGDGLIISQLGAVVMGAVGASETGQAGGLQGTIQNLGGAIGTALVGAVLIAGLTQAFDHSVSVDAQISAPTERRIAAANRQGIAFVPSAAFRERLSAAGAPDAEVARVVDHYNDSQIDALRDALLAVAAIALLSFAFLRDLPRAGPRL